MIKRISKSERNEVVSGKQIENNWKRRSSLSKASSYVYCRRLDTWVACGALQRLFPALLLSFPFPANIGKRELLKSAPWRVEEEEDDKFEDAKLKVTNQPGSTPVMHVPGKKLSKSKNGVADDGDDSLTEMDPELRYSFQRNFQASPSSSNSFLKTLSNSILLEFRPRF